MGKGAYESREEHRRQLETLLRRVEARWPDLWDEDSHRAAGELDRALRERLRAAVSGLKSLVPVGEEAGAPAMGMGDVTRLREAAADPKLKELMAIVHEFRDIADALISHKLSPTPELERKAAELQTVMVEWSVSRNREATSEQLVNEVYRLWFLYSDDDFRWMIRAAEKVRPRPDRKRRREGSESWSSPAGQIVKFQISFLHRRTGLSQLASCVKWQEETRQRWQRSDLGGLSYFVDLDAETLKRAVFGR